MSNECMTYVWKHSKQKGSALLCLIAIADHAHDDGTGAYPSVETLAKKIRMSVRNTQYLLRKLEEAGELIIDIGAGPKGCNLMAIPMEGVQILQGANQRQRGVQKSTPAKRERGVQSVAPKPSMVKPSVKTTTMADGANAPGGGAQGDCSWNTESYRYLMALPKGLKPWSANAKTVASIPLAQVKEITEHCIKHNLGAGMLINMCRDCLENPPPPPVEAAPTDDTPEPEIIPPPFMPMDEWTQIVSPFEREVWALTVYRDGVLTTDSTLDRHINYDYAARRDRILARIGGGA